MEAYHGTKIENKKEIETRGFTIRNKPKHIPNDLGNGIYFFLDKGDVYKPPYEMSKSFVKNYKDCSHGESVIFKVTISDNLSLLNFNDEDNEKLFEKFRNLNLNTILKHYDNFIYYAKTNTGDVPGVLKRANLDGIVFELLKNKIKCDGVIKDTYTPQNKKYKKSSFHNGRELCLYNIEKIDEIKEIVEPEKGDM
ncbi:hypothetical protein [Streptococcus salivarius]